MKAMIIPKYGEDANFELNELDKPGVKPNEVLVKIAASSVNTVDTMIKNMRPELPLSPTSPALLGMDFDGTIEAIGNEMKDFKMGEEVYGCAGGLTDLPGALVSTNIHKI